MKQYRTLVQGFTDNKSIGNWLDDNCIRYHLSADFSEYVNLRDTHGPGVLINTYTALIDDDDLTAMKLTLGDIHEVKLQGGYRVRNLFRRMFSWFFR